MIGGALWEECDRPSSRGAFREGSASRVHVCEWGAVEMAAATQRAPAAKLPLCVLEVALALAQSQAMTTAVVGVRLLTSGVQRSHWWEHAGLWGLARSARAEALVPLQCLGGEAATASARGTSHSEPELALHRHALQAPRLQTSPALLLGFVRLHFSARGAISNLFLESQPALPPPGEGEVLLRVRAVGLNFRDVLNVLGEYPGDPGPPGADASGMVLEASSSLHRVGDAAFGLGHAPLASTALASAACLVRQVDSLAFEQACTLPITWSTSHVAVERAQLCAGRSIITQAAAGGVGLKAVEYAQWLQAACIGTAGQPHKHVPLRGLGVDALCSSRSAVGFAWGLACLVSGGRAHAVLNSLSRDFIATSFAVVGEGGAFEEIGKRGIWSPACHLASGSATLYSAIALDVDIAYHPAWMHCTLSLLSARAAVGAATSLPLSSFDMGAQYELAFRTLQSGLNTGKVVVRIAASHSALPSGGHVVTGGTSGLGLLTGRWLAQHGASCLVLASRGGVLVRDTAVEWAAVEESNTVTCLERCDTGEATHVHRLMASAPWFEGMWHAAGVLSDALLSKQAAPTLTRSYAPKAHGSWSGAGSPNKRGGVTRSGSAFGMMKRTQTSVRASIEGIRHAIR